MTATRRAAGPDRVQRGQIVREHVFLIYEKLSTTFMHLSCLPTPLCTQKTHKQHTQGGLRLGRKRARGDGHRARQEGPQVHLLHAALCHGDRRGGRPGALQVQADQDMRVASRSVRLPMMVWGGGGFHISW